MKRSFALIVLSAAAATQATASNPLQGLGLLPNAVPSGTSVGIRFDMSADGTTFVKNNFRWNAGSWSTIPLGAGQSFQAHGVSGDGLVVVGKLDDTTNSQYSGAIWRNNTFHLLNTELLNFASFPAANYADDDGSVVLSQAADVNNSAALRRRYVWNGAAYVGTNFAFDDIMGSNTGSTNEQGWRGIADNGSAGLGYNFGPADIYANRESSSAGPAFNRPPSLNVPAGNTFIDEQVVPSGMSGNGLVIVGNYQWLIIGPQGSSGNQNFRWNNGVTTLMPTMPVGTELDFVGEHLAAGSQVYVHSLAASFSVATFLTNNGVTITNWSNLSCTEVSSDGLCFSGIGTHTTSNGNVQEIWFVKIPSPGTLALAASGSLLLVRRRR